MAAGTASAGDGKRSLGILGVLPGAGGLHGVTIGTNIGGAQFLEDVRNGQDVDWEQHGFMPDQADCLLAVLGLLHMRVKCMIFVMGGSMMLR